MLSLSGAQVCTRVHQGRLSDFRRGRRLGQDDHLITWTRLVRPAWMSPEAYDRIPPDAYAARAALRRARARAPDRISHRGHHADGRGNPMPEPGESGYEKGCVRGGSTFASK